MQKIIQVDKTVVVILNNGTALQRDNLTEGELEIIMDPQSEDYEIMEIMNPDYGNAMREVRITKEVLDRVEKSNILTKDGDAIYWLDISQLSIPKELVKSILDAEDAEDEIKIETYRNFWTLMSLNPNEQCRLNLYWFLERNGLVISRSGFFVAYRNADFVRKEDDGKDVFTDAHTHTFRIKIGEMVTMPREKCDNRQEVTCSRGLICSPLY